MSQPPPTVVICEEVGMTDSGIRRPDGSVVYIEELEAALAEAAREVHLKHAQLGHPICISRDGKVVWIQPEEIFSWYGLDANGKPRPS